jgi:peptidoglycan/xylan/chitin deacetylase (PgdA/CDA1 family)
MLTLRIYRGNAMKKSTMRRAAALAMSVFLAGCASMPTLPSRREPSAPPPAPEAIESPRSSGDYVAVIAQPGDTYASLAATHLGDPSRRWVIEEFNRTGPLRPGEGLVIPLRPFKPGGLERGRYQTVSVLSYHKIAESGSDGMTVTRSDFESQMRFLKENGYRVVTMDEFFDFLDFKGDLPEKSVVITFDDGWRSLYDLAFPILKRYGYPATLFISTNMITGSDKTLSWDQIREMAASGIDMQCHTVDHRNLPTRKEGESFREYFEDVERELTRSTGVIEENLGKKARYLAYPYGDTSHLVIVLLKKLGYRGALTVNRGANPFFTPNYRVRRSMIFGDFDLSRFEKNLAVHGSRALR